MPSFSFPSSALRSAGLALVTAGALLVSGCGGGSDSDKASDVTLHYLHALGDKDFASACDDATSQAQKDISSQAQLGAKNCADLLKLVFSQVTDDQLKQLKDAKVKSVKVSGTSATVQLQGGSGAPAKLTKVDGDWKIATFQ